MEDAKLLGGQRYFISKVIEYFDPQQSYIFTKVLQDKRYDSISLMLDEFLEINRDIKEGTNDKSKLKNSLNSSLKSILFHCKQNPLLIKGSFSRDVNYLIKKIDAYLKEPNDLSLNTISTSISSLFKRYSSKNLIEEYIDLIIQKSHSYKDIDLIVEYFVSELINLEYSFKYLSEWKKSQKLFKANIKSFTAETIGETLSSFKDLIKEPIKYTILLNSWLPDEIKTELESEGVIHINYKYKNPKDEEVEAISQNQLNFSHSDQYKSLTVEVDANDKYKAIEKVVKNIENYLEMYKRFYDFDKVAVNVNCLLSSDKGEWVKMRTDNTDTQVFSKSIGERENEDIRDFLLLRDKVRKENGKINTTIMQLNNSFDMLNKSINSTVENRLLNNWSSLEYLLNSYEGKSIIGKIIDIVPKVISLYFVKDRLNILWDKLQINKGIHEIEIVKDLLRECSKAENKYDKNKLVEFLRKESNLEELYSGLEQDAVMHREIAFLREILNDLSKTLENVRGIHDSIEHDLTRIYRVRNKLVHSHNSISYNVDILTIRLNKYVNSLLGTITHYLKRNPHLDITEVLNSIYETYEWYLDFIKKEYEKNKKIIKAKSEQKATNLVLDIKTLAFPPYLYL